MKHPSRPRAAEASVEARDLRRSFGAVRALDGFDVSLPWGQVIALVGPNGAGKTTLLLVLAGLLGPDGGRALVAGVNPGEEPFEAHRLVGWMPDFFGVYDDLTPREYLELFGAAYRLERSEVPGRAEDLLDAVGLLGAADVKVHTLSRGQKQRLGFARAILHRPRVLLLDEPASGLDPRARIELRKLMRSQAAEGVAVLVSSHILAELEEVADTVVFVDKGRCTGVYPLRELPVGLRTWRVRALDRDALRRAIRGAGFDYVEGDDGGVRVALPGDEAAAELCARLVAAGAAPVEFAPDGGELERAFLSFSQREAR